MAVIGTGPWGRRLIRVLAELEVLALVCNRGDAEGQDWVRSVTSSVRVSSSPREAIEDPTIDCVVVATAISSHASLAADAMQAGKHVFVEKPLAMSSPEAWSLVELSERTDRRLFVGHTFLYDAGLERLGSLLVDDPARDASFSWLKYGTFREPLVWNLLPHEVSLALWLIGQPGDVEILDQGAGPTALDRLRLRMTFGDPDRSSEIEIDRLSAIRTKTAQITTRSGVRHSWRDGKLVVGSSGPHREWRGGRTEEPLLREMRAFLSSVVTGRPPRSDGRFGARVVEVVERIAGVIAQGATRDLGEGIAT